MEEFLKNKYGIDINTPLSDQTESFQVGDVVNLLRKNGSEKNVIHNLHNSALNKRQVLEYLDNIKNQLVLEGDIIIMSKNHEAVDTIKN